VIGPRQKVSGLGYSHPLSNLSKNGINSENQTSLLGIKLRFDEKRTKLRFYEKRRKLRF
jgi:hypothetical protein